MTFMRYFMSNFMSSLYVWRVRGVRGAEPPAMYVWKQKNPGHPYISVEVAVVIIRRLRIRASCQ